MGKNYTDFSGSKNPRYKTGCRMPGADPKFYNSWQNMKRRCLNPNHPNYRWYGGRGIKICDEWLTADGFAKWAEISGFESGLTLDRIDVNGDYCPENCQWITLSENSRKKRTTKITPEKAREIRTRLALGEFGKDLAKEFNVIPATIWNIQHSKFL